MKLYHVTSMAGAHAIMRDGFRDGHLSGMVGLVVRGVSFAESPAGVNDGAVAAEVCIEVDVPDSVAAQHELLEEIVDDDEWADLPEGMNAIVTEWLIPADIANVFPRRLLSDDEHWALPCAPRRFRYWADAAR